jgi:hypothetical protein
VPVTMCRLGFYDDRSKFGQKSLALRILFSSNCLSIVSIVDTLSIGPFAKELTQQRKRIPFCALFNTYRLPDYSRLFQRIWNHRL